MSAQTQATPAPTEDLVQHDQMPHGADPMSSGPGKAKRFALSELIGPIITFALFIGLWYFMHYWGLRHLFDKPEFLITEPHRVFKESFVDSLNRATLLDGLWVTTKVALIGLAIAIVIGMVLAVAMAQASWLEKSLWPYLVALQAIPILGLTPVIGNIFGFEIPSRILVCVIISIFPIAANTLFGLLSVERGQHDLFTLRGVGRWRRLFKLQLPAAMPTIFAGFRIAAGLSVIGAIVGEIFFKRGDKGLGILMDTFRSRLNNPLMYGALVLSALLGIAVFVIFGFFSRLAVGRWYETTRKTG